MQKNKIILIQLWLGKIPDYFWFHYETTKNLEIDFLFVTDQKISLTSKNYKVLVKSKQEIEKKLSNILNTNLEIKNNPKTSDLKCSYGYLFEEYLNDYDYYGFYDIDTLFGNVQKFIQPFLNEYDFISLGDELIHKRLSGTFTIIKNKKEFRELFISDKFSKCFENPKVQCFEESYYSEIVFKNFKVKLVDSTNFSLNNGGKIIFESFWSGGGVFVRNEEKLLHHFFWKNQTKIEKMGNIITTKFIKSFEDDFLWVVHFTENYETLLPQLMNSIMKYSSRKCVLYSINYTPNFLFQTQFVSDQFIFRRIDIETGTKDVRGRDSSILNSKPIILSDAIKNFPNKKFVHIDTDIHFTTNSDDITKFFGDLENYPLVNTHIHDVMLLSGLRDNEEWSSSLHILLETIGETKQPVFPRRKCNIMLFDYRSFWFFEEHIKIYNKYKNENIPGLFAFHDEDITNAILTKYQFTKSLPLLDIEESYNLELNKIFNYSYNNSGTSQWVKPPQTINDILFFHGFKDVKDFEKIEQDYGSSVLDKQEFIFFYYKDNEINFKKNTFLSDKKIHNNVNIIITNFDDEILFNLSDQNIYYYSTFFVSNIDLPKKIKVKIIENNSNKCIFSTIFHLESDD